MATSSLSMCRSCFLLQLVTLILLHSTCILALSEKCNPQDKRALLQIKKGLNNPSALSSWDPHTDCCDDTTKPWKGVTCGDCSSSSHQGNYKNRVNYLSISDIDLHPHLLPIPSSIGNLPFLNSLHIDRIPNLIGPIPETITNLTNLRYLSITNTLLSGTIPDYLGDLRSLVTLDLSNSNLAGGIPPSLSNLHNLQGISLDGNWLSGSIPDSFGSFNHFFFTSLTLSRNQLSGDIPQSLGNLNLAFVDLSSNRFTGDASMLFGSNKRTQRIDLSRNRLEFDFGKVGLSRNLEALDLRKNGIYGRLPRGLTALRFLRELNVSYNSLSGEIPKGGYLQSFHVSSFVHNKGLCGSPLPSCKANRA